MARSKQDVISEMVDSGLFSDDEIRTAARKTSLPPQDGGRNGSLAAGASSVLMGVPTREIGSPSGMVKRLAEDTFEGFRPPINMEETKRFLNPNAGQYGPNRFSQDVIDTAAQNANKQAENFVQLPGVNRFPRIAAAIGTAGAMAPLMLPSPKSLQQGVGIGAGVAGAKAAEMWARGIGSKAGRALVGMISPASMDAVNARFDNPSAVKNALTREQLGNTVVASQNELGNQIRKLDVNAKNTLSGEHDLAKEALIQKLQALKQRYVGASREAISSSAKGAIAELDNAIHGLQNINPMPDKAPIDIQTGEQVLTKYLPPFGSETVRTPVIERIPGSTNRTSEMMSERQLKDVMSQYKDINWDDPAGGAKKEIRKAMDVSLKGRNPEYEQAMKPVADRTKLQAIVDRKLSLKYDPTTGNYATDATAGKWTPSMLEGKKPETSQALKRLGKYTGTDLMEKARMTNFREQFEGGKTQGSRMVQLGRHLAGVPGAMIGGIIDKVGGNISGRLIDTLAAIPTIPNLNANAEKTMILAIANALKRRNQNAQR